jgi:DNA repair protein RadC
MAGEIGGLPSFGSGDASPAARPVPPPMSGCAVVVAQVSMGEAPAHRCAARSVRDLPAAERPRERLALRGPAGLSAAELIAIVLGTGGGGGGAVELAETVLARFAGVAALARASDAELEAIQGLGPAKAARLAAAFELGRRSVADWPAGRWTIRAPRDVADRLVVDVGRLEREELRVLSLNAKNVVQRMTTVYVGNVSASLVRIGELFRDAVRLDASGVVLVHNHPSGDPTPSPEDLHLTAEAIAAGRLLDVEVLDHVIVGHDAWVSLRDRGISFDRAGPLHPP